MKVVFLVAITSARRVGDLEVLMAVPPYMVFHKDKVSLRLYPKFIPKGILEFHLNQVIHFPVFHLKPHATKEDWEFPLSVYPTSLGLLLAET